MKLKNILIVVSDIEKSKEFYRDLFGLQVIRDFGQNVMLTEGLVLQEKKSWEQLVEKEAVCGGYDAELYFEESDMDSFLAKLNDYECEVKFLNACITNACGQRVVRIYDPDDHVIEIKEVTS